MTCHGLDAGDLVVCHVVVVVTPPLPWDEGKA